MRIPPPPGMTCGRFLNNTVQSLDRHSKSALLFDMYSQQFTLCYYPVKSPRLRIRFYNFLRHQSVSGAPPPKKNPGSAPASSLLHQVKARYNSYEYYSFYKLATQNKFTSSKSAP